MKAFNLKKKSCFILLVMMAMALFTGCSDDKDDTDNGSDFEFPELVEITLNVDETVTISFNATANWQLTSNAGWCKFINGDFTESTMSGKSGKQNITAKIFSDSQGYTNDDVAEIKLATAEKEQVIYRITRPKKIFGGLTVKDGEGNAYDEEHPIQVKGSGIYDVVTTSIVAEAENAVIGIVDCPDWIEAVGTGEPGEFSLTFKKDNKENLDPKYSFGTDKGYSITFGVEINNETITVSIPVTYEGLKAGEFAVDPQYFNLKISENGKKITSGGQGISGSTQVYNEKITTAITTRNDAYQIVMFEQQGYYMTYPGMDPIYMIDDYIFDNANTGWVHETKNGAEYSLTFDTFTPAPYDPTANRGVVVMAFPENVYEEIKGNLKTNIIDAGTMDIRSDYQNYIVATAVQKEDAKVSFKTYALSSGELMEYAMMSTEPIKEYTDASVTETDNVYKGDFTSEHFTGFWADAIYIEVQNFEEGMNIEQKGTITNLQMSQQAGFIQWGMNDGKQYIVLTPSSTDSITGTMDIYIKSGDEVVSLLKIEFTAIN